MCCQELAAERRRLEHEARVQAEEEARRATEEKVHNTLSGSDTEVVGREVEGVGKKWVSWRQCMGGGGGERGGGGVEGGVGRGVE